MLTRPAQAPVIPLLCWEGMAREVREPLVLVEEVERLEPQVLLYAWHAGPSAAA